MDQADDDRTARLEAFITDLRSRCTDKGAPAALVNSLHVEGLLALYRRLLTDEEKEHKDLERLMSEMPKAA